MKVKIEKQIKEFYGSKASFCKVIGVTTQNSTRHINRLVSRIDKINKELKDLGLKLELKEI